MTSHFSATHTVQSWTSSPYSTSSYFSNESLPNLTQNKDSLSLLDLPNFIFSNENASQLESNSASTFQNGSARKQNQAPQLVENIQHHSRQSIYSPSIFQPAHPLSVEEDEYSSDDSFSIDRKQHELFRKATRLEAQSKLDFLTDLHSISTDSKETTNSDKQEIPANALQLSEKSATTDVEPSEPSRVWLPAETKNAIASASTRNCTVETSEEIADASFLLYSPSAFSESGFLFCVKIATLLLYGASVCMVGGIAWIYAPTKLPSSRLVAKYGFIWLLFLQCFLHYFAVYKLFSWFWGSFFFTIQALFVVSSLLFLLWTIAFHFWLSAVVLIMFIALSTVCIYFMRKNVETNAELLFLIRRMCPYLNSRIFFTGFFILLHFGWLYISLKGMEAVSSLGMLRSIPFNLLMLFCYLWTSEVAFYVLFLIMSSPVFKWYGIDEHISRLSHLRICGFNLGSCLLFEVVQRILKDHFGSYLFGFKMVGFTALFRGVRLILLHLDERLDKIGGAIFTPQSLLRAWMFSISYFKAHRSQHDEAKCKGYQVIFDHENISNHITLLNMTGSFVITLFFAVIYGWNDSFVIFALIAIFYQLRLGCARFYTIPSSVIFSFEIFPDPLLHSHPLLYHRFVSVTDAVTHNQAN